MQLTALLYKKYQLKKEVVVFDMSLTVRINEISQCVNAINTWYLVQYLN